MLKGDDRMKRTRGFEVVSDLCKQHTNLAFSPSRADGGSAGYDFFSPANFTIRPGGAIIVWTNVKAYMLPDEVLKIYSRSSMGKVRVSLANGTGIIDSSYYNNPENEGNIGLIIENNGEDPFYISTGQAIAQGIFQKYLTADTDLIRKTDRTGGFGSSDE